MAIGSPSHTRGKHTSDSWITPRWLVDRLGPFDLDPCESDPQPWPCARTGYKEHGLLRPWFGVVWCNPPYGRALKNWLNRMALHNNGIALVFARTETDAFFSGAWPFASAMLFLRGRLTFAYPDGSLPRNNANSGGPSVLIGYGTTAEQRLLACRDLGAVVKQVRDGAEFSLQ
jgi:DNA N-6-adenine-methyltransferase (Dam)